MNGYVAVFFTEVPIPSGAFPLAHGGAIARIAEMAGDNVVLIGMPGAGKSTVGVLLARTLGYTFLDTDLLIQEREGETLQAVVDRLGQPAFRALEERTICTLEARRTVIATGGSVVYYPAAAERLGVLGRRVWLRLDFPETERRVALFPNRGLAITPEQTLRDLYDERQPLYRQYADLTVDAGQPPEQVVAAIRQAVG